MSISGKPWWADAFPSRDKVLQLSTLSTAMSGAVATVAHISSNNLVLANTGDCQVLIMKCVKIVLCSVLL